MNDEERIPVSAGLKFVALLLIIGGVVGIGLTFWLYMGLIVNPRILPSPPRAIIGASIVGAFIVSFGWAAWTGRNLWLGYKQGIRSAQILFALQIPIFQVPGFAYEFHTGFTLPIMIAARFNFGFQLGSSFIFNISPKIQGVAIGINLFALLVLIYLLQRSRRLSAVSQPDPSMEMR